MDDHVYINQHNIYVGTCVQLHPSHFDMCPQVE